LSKKHYEERFEKDLQDIKNAVQRVGKDVEASLLDAVTALANHDCDLAYRTILKDQAVNRQIEAVDQKCYVFVVRHLPSAGPLRFISAVLRSAVSIERIGDYAVTICRETARLREPPPAGLLSDLNLLIEEARVALHQCLEAFATSNSELARSTKTILSDVGHTFDRIFEDLVRESDRASRPVQDLFALLVVFNRLSRVCDQAKNICEETVFIATGEAKGPKVFRILFVDERNDALSQLAAALATRDHPLGASFYSAGWSPAEQVREDVRQFLKDRDCSLVTPVPTALNLDLESLSRYDIVITLEGGDTVFDRFPYHTVWLRWSLPTGVSDQDIETVASWLIGQTEELMLVLRGPE
jgi:phosphate transport system protein